MHRPIGIRRKIWAVFIQQMAAISLAGLLGVYVVASLIENLILREIVLRETAQFVERQVDDPATPPPQNSFVRGYLHSATGDTPGLPAEIAGLPPGYHGPSAKRPAVSVADTPAGRLFVVSEQRRLHAFVFWIGFGLFAIILGTVYVTAWLAYRASRRALAPIVVLAETVRSWDPKAPDIDALLPENLPVELEVDEDVGSLAQALHGFAVRLEEFVDRERNFTRDASHELRTPLTVIKVGADILLDEEGLPAFARRTAGRIRRAARDMEALIDSFLILAREDGVGLPEEDFTVNEAVREEVERARPLIDDKPVHLSVEERAVYTLHTSPRAFGVLIGNLIRNACMYTERGSITVTIDEACVIVHDTGVGMSEEDLAHLFESFYRGSVRSKGEGHGIGLSIVKRLADRFGWEIAISSQLGSGTTIRVDFPALVQERE
jgi:signal transduction histidine kinase